MFNPTLPERIIHQIEMRTKSLRAPFQRKKLNNTDFTIISNNCWGGVIYESFGLAKQSPTVGCYFFADDYLKFIRNLEYYFSLEIKMITAQEARHKEQIIKNGNTDCPIGVLDDVEIIFVHYKEAALAKDKWTRRVKRVNWDNLIFKFSYMNSCNKEQLKEFDSLELPGKKFMFVPEKEHQYKCGVYYPGFEDDDQIYNDTFYYNRYFDVPAFINGNGIKNRT